jgi:flavin reductase (DIM6/NTAB) family NADH-FMN oxidoreductase RutF
MPLVKFNHEELTENVFKLIGDRWMLITAGDRDGFNTMTASWGGLGVLWGMPVATCYIRPHRYTYGFMEKGQYYTLSFYPESFRKQLAICGTKSGRDIDKVKECGFTPAFTPEGAVYFEEAELVLVCKKIYFADFDPGHFLDVRIAEQYHPDDYHRMYIGEIVGAYKKA